MGTEIFVVVVISLLALTTLFTLPGPILIAITVFIYALQAGFSKITPDQVIIFFVAGVAGFFIDNIFALAGAKSLGATRAGIIGAILGFGAVLLVGPPGIVIGPVAGAFFGELVFSKQPADKAFKAAVGTLIGLMTGIIAKMVIAIGLVLYFVSIVI